MKKISLSFISCFICAAFVLSPLNACALPLWEELIETAFSEFIAASNETDENGNKKGLVGVAKDFQSHIMEGSFLNPIIVNDEINFQVPNYEIITGRYQLHSDFRSYDDSDNVTSEYSDDTMIECTWLMSDNSTDWNSTKAVARDTHSGKYYFNNALNLQITFSTGNVQNVVCKFRTNQYNNINHTNNFISIGTGYVDVYIYTGDTLEQILYSNHYCHGIKFTFTQKNLVTVNLNDIITPTSGDKVQAFPSGFNEYGASGNNVTPKVRMTIEDIIASRCYVLYDYNSSFTGSAKWKGFTFYPLDYLCISFYVTNNNSVETTANNNWENNYYSKNYYIDNTYEGGTVIDVNNGDTYLGGNYLPALNIDPDLPLAEILDLLTDLLPDFKLGLEPSLGLNIDDLFDRLFDFYADMPPIDMNFDPSLDTENYWDIQLPDSGGGGGGSGDDNIVVTVDVNITRPLITVYGYEDPVSLADLPVITTYTVPAQVQSAADTVLDSGNSILETAELLPIYAFLTLIGIGVAIAFKGV